MSHSHRSTRRAFLELSAGAAALTLARHGQGAASAAIASDSARANTPPDRPPDFSIGLIADAQYADQPDSGVRLYRDSLRKMRECAEDLNQGRLEFTVHLGDFIDQGAHNFAPINAEFEKIRSPRYHVLGNHDYAVDDIAPLARRYGMADDRTYYAFASHGWHFSFLDTNRFSVQAAQNDPDLLARAEARMAALKAEGRNNAQTWNGALGEAQTAWLEKVLDAADRDGEPAMIFAHHPIHPPAGHNAWDDRETLDLIARHRSVRVFLCGHNHSGNCGEKHGALFLTLEGMVDTNANAYSVAHFYHDRIHFAGRGRSGQIVFPLRAREG